MAKKPLLCDEGMRLYKIWNEKAKKLANTTPISQIYMVEENEAYNDLARHKKDCKGCLRIE